MQLVWDLTDVGELTLATRLVDTEPLNTSLSRWLPDQSADSIDYSFAKANRTRVAAAPFRAFDTPAPIRARRGPAARVRGELPPISIGLPVTEDNLQRLRSARAAGGNDQIDAIFDHDARDASRLVRARVELARGQALSTGKVTIGTEDDPENGLFLSVDFGMPPEHFITAPALWNDSTTDILGQLETWRDLYVETTDGLAPAVLLVSRLVRANMLKNDGVRQLTGNLLGVPTGVTSAALGQILADRDLPRVETYDGQVTNLEGVRQRVIPQNRALLLPDPDGSPEDLPGLTQWGRTLEADEIVREGQLGVEDAPGLAVVVYQSQNPINFLTLAAGIVLPTMHQSQMVLSAKVLPD